MPETGQTLSHYRILEKLGEGGMGEVYRAQDTHLGRQVAIKILPDLFSTDPERLARFEREARLLASLSHQNIAAIHGLEEADGKRFIVMELAEGETLAKRIRRASLPADDALDVCRQIAEGLEAAHEQRIIHRDLKPGNVMVSGEGKVKILDFGLAKAFQEELSPAEIAQSTTLTDGMTLPGVILGTAAYMSPEQAKGKPVDKRTDIWAFGCILYECLTGKRAFRGETVAETLAAVLHGEPDWDALPDPTPARIRDLLRRCLQRDADRRLRDIADARLEIEDAGIEAPAPAGERRRSRHEAIPWALAAFAIVAAVTLGVWEWSRRDDKGEPTLTHVLPPADSVSCFRDGFAVSPDGRRIAFVSLSSRGERLLWVRSLDRTESSPLAGTEGASDPFWKPNGEEIAFYARGKLKRVSANGNSIEIVSRASLMGRSGTWGASGMIAFAGPLGGMARIAQAGGEAERLSIEGQFPFFLPDGSRFLYTAPSIFVGSLEDTALRRQIPGSDDAHQAQWAAPDLVVFSRFSDRALVAQRIDIEQGRAVTAPRVLFERIHYPRGKPAFSVSRRALAVLVQEPGEPHDERHRLLWLDRRGNVIRPMGPEGGYWWTKISHDGKRVAINPDNDAWVFDAASGLGTRLTDARTRAESQAACPIWSPNDDRIIFHVPDLKGGDLLRELPVSGGPPRDIIAEPGIRSQATDWSRDGRYLAITHNRASPDLAVFDTQEQKLSMLSATEFNESDGQFSPDGHWIAYESDRTGRYEIYIQPFPGPGGARRISHTGGMHPRWREDGRELFFVAPDWTVMAVEAKPQPSMDIGTPAALFRMVMADIVGGLQSPYDAAPDGQQFLVIVPQSAPAPLTLIQYWAALLDR